MLNSKPRAKYLFSGCPPWKEVSPQALLWWPLVAPHGPPKIRCQSHRSCQGLSLTLPSPGQTHRGGSSPTLQMWVGGLLKSSWCDLFSGYGRHGLADQEQEEQCWKQWHLWNARFKVLHNSAKSSFSRLSWLLMMIQPWATKLLWTAYILVYMRGLKVLAIPKDQWITDVS